jgi:hypothetical protein
MTSKATDGKCHFLALPLEIRREIYSQVFFDQPYSGKTLSKIWLVVPAMNLQPVMEPMEGSEDGSEVRSEMGRPPLHPEILRVCRTCLQEAAPILCSKVALKRETGPDMSHCIPSIRRFGTQNLSLIRGFAMEISPQSLHQGFVTVCEIVDLMPELRVMYITVRFYQSFISRLHGTCSVDDQAKLESHCFAPDACLVKSIKPKLQIHRYLSKIVEESESDGSRKTYAICSDEDVLDGISTICDVCPTLFTC